jgi:hypothetical protein
MIPKNLQMQKEKERFLTVLILSQLINPNLSFPSYDGLEQSNPMFISWMCLPPLHYRAGEIKKEKAFMTNIRQLIVLLG